MGANVSNLAGYIDFNTPLFYSSAGYNFGIYTQKNIAERISIKLGTEYTSLGTNLKVSYSNKLPYNTIKEKHHFNYLMFPIIFAYEATKRIDLEVGTQFGYFINGRVKTTFSFDDTQKPDSIYIHVGNASNNPIFNNSTNYYFNPLRVTLHLGANFKILPQWSLHFAYLNDATDLIEAGRSTALYHNVSFQSSICYYIRKHDIQVVDSALAVAKQAFLPIKQIQAY